MKTHSLLPFVLILLITLPLLSGCGPSSSAGPYVWIDVPEDGLSFPEFQPVIVQGHAAGGTGISRIELSIDGELWTTIDDPPLENNLTSFQTEWLPEKPGTYLISAVVYGTDDAPGSQDQTRITIGIETSTPVRTGTPTFTPTPEISITPTLTYTPTPVISITPTFTDTPTPVEPRPATVQFWADPDTIEAGNCTDLRWQVENAQTVIFGGQEQPETGTYQVCLCSTETYTLTVIHQDGTETKHRVNINVSGTCADTVPPPAPVQVVPADGLSIDCKAGQTLAWQPVSDPSGISQYQVQVQRHSGGGVWQEVSGSAFTGITDKQYSLTVECGWTYRWQVRAVDGEGNVGPWSGWWTFVIVLE